MQDLKTLQAPSTTGTAAPSTTEESVESLHDPLVLPTPELDEGPPDPPGGPSKDGTTTEDAPSDAPDAPLAPTTDGGSGGGEAPIAPESKSESVQIHEAMADAAAAELAEQPGTSAELKKLSDRLARHFTKRLEPGVEMSITWGDMTEGFVDGTIRIAPNDTVLDITIPTVDGDLRPPVADLVRKANAILSGSKAKKDVNAGDNKPIQFLFEVAKAPPDVQQAFLQVAGTALLEIFEKARLPNLWKDQPVAEMVVELLQGLKGTHPAIAKKMAKELLSTHLLSFDLSVDRWEARLAWEIIRVLPPNEQKALLKDRPMGQVGSDARDDDHELAGKVERVQLNTSVEFRNSSRFTTFTGEERTAVDGTVGDDTAKESIVARIQDGSTWSGDQGALKAALKMAIRSGSTPLIVSDVRAHYKTHKELLMGLGFTEEGRYVEDIQDNTFTTWFTRTLAGVKAVFSVLGAAWSLLSGPGGVKEIPLENIEKSFLAKYGVQFDHTKDVKDEFDLVETLLGNVGNAKMIMDFFGFGPTELLGVLNKGIAAGQKIQSYLDGKATVKKLTDKDPANNGGKPNTMTIAQDQDSGATVVAVALLPIASQAAIIGDMTVKMGAGVVQNGVVELKAATVHDGKQYFRVSVQNLIVTDLQVATQDSLLMIDKVGVSGFHFEAIGEDEKPADLLARIFMDVWEVIIQIASLLPSGFVASAMDAFKDGMQAWNSIEKVQGSMKQLGFGFDKVVLAGLHTADGTNLDSLEIGATELGVTVDHTFDLNEMDRDDLEERKADLEEDRQEAKEDLAKAEKKGKGNSKSAKILREQITWFDRAIANVAHQLAVLDQLAPMVKKVEELTKKREKREEAIRDAAKDAVKKKDGRRWERNQAADDAVVGNKELEAIDKEIGDLQLKIQLLQGAKASGHLGAVTMKGLKTDTMEIASLTTSQGVIKDSKLGLDAAGLSVGFDDVTIEGMKLKDGSRRDLVLADRIKTGKKTIEDVEAKAKKESRPLAQAESKQIADVKKEIAGWEGELAELKPLTEEYAALRARITDRRNPLSESEKKRLQQITDLLAQPPSVEVGKVELHGVSLDAGIKDPTSGDTKKMMSGATLGLQVKSGTVTDVHLRGEGADGDTRIDQVGITDAKLDFNAMVDGGKLSVGAGKLDVTGLKTDGTRAGLQHQLDAIDHELGLLAGWLAELEPRRGDKQADAEIGRLEARKAILEGKRAEVAKKMDSPQALDQFMADVDATRPKLVDRAGIDRSRGFSVKAGKDAVLTLNGAIREITHGKTGKDGEVCLDQATKLVATYETGVAALNKQIAAIGKPKKAGKQPKSLAEQSSDAFKTYDAAELKKQLDAAKAELATWKAHHVDLTKALEKAQGQKFDLQLIMASYEGLIAEGGAIPLDLKLAGVKGLDELSADQMKSLARAQKQGMDGWSVGKLTVEGLGLEIDNISSILNAKPDAETYEQVVRIGGAGGGDMVKSVHVEDVKQGDRQVVGDLDLSGLGGEVQILGPDRYKIAGLKLATFNMGELSWESASMGVDAKAIALAGMKVDADISYKNEELTGTISRFTIDTFDARQLDLRYGDQIYKFGTLSADGQQGQKAPKLSGIEVTDLDLSTMAMGAVKLNGLKTTDLKADLGGGMTTSVKRMVAGNITIKAMVTDANRKKTEEKNAAKKEGEEKEALGANKYSFDISGLSADQMRVKMQESGLDVKIDTIRGGDLHGISIDLQTGELHLDDLDMQTMKLGPISYKADGMKLEVLGGIDLTGVHLAGRGKLLFDEELEKKLRQQNPKKVPDYVQNLKLSMISAESAKLRSLRLAMEDGSGKTDVLLQSAEAKKLKIRDYDFATGSMKIDLGATTLDGLSATLKSKLSTTTVSGGMSLGGLSYEALNDKNGDPVKSSVAFKDVGTNGLHVKQTNFEEGTGKKKDETELDLGMSGLTGKVDMQGDAWSEDGAVTTFSDIKLTTLKMPNLHWNSGGGEATDILAKGASVEGLRVSGHTVTRMQTKSGMPLPSTDLFIDNLHVDKVAASTIKVDGQSVNDDQERRQTTTTMGTGTKPAVTLTNIDVVGLESIAGKIEKGRIDMGTLDAQAKLDSKLLGGKFGTIFNGASELSAKGMFVEWQDGGKRMVAGAKEAEIGNAALIMTLDSKGSNVVVTVPKAKVSGVDFSQYDYGDAKGGKSANVLGNLTQIKVGSVELLENGVFQYYNADTRKLEKLDNEKTNDERRDERVAMLPGSDKHQEMKDKHDVMSSIEMDDLMKTINGTIDANVDADTLVDVGMKVHLKVTNGKIAPVAAPGSGWTARTSMKLIAKALTFDLVDYTEMIVDKTAPDPDKLVKEKRTAHVEDQMDAGPWYRSGTADEYEKEANARFDERRTKIQDKEDLIKKYKGKKGFEQAVAKWERELEDLYHPTEASDDWVDVFLSNIDAKLDLGPWETKILPPKSQPNGPSSLLRIGKSKLKFEPGTGRTHKLGLDMKAVSFGTSQGDGRNLKMSSVSMDGLTVQATLASLFPGGSYRVWGWDKGAGSGKIANPISGSIDKGTKITGMEIQSCELLKRAGTP